MINIKFEVQLDGNAWVCYGPDFINIQESECEYGDTEREAVILYVTKRINEMYS